ncbi:hypothetical protein LJR084_007786 [Variovorax sp. LjRoot84]|uniref:hypothetical protein n=1 Tax=Variovorax sp. LjRoot84 TaxID=3342340 RepID=UPI003ECFB2B9
MTHYAITQVHAEGGVLKRVMLHEIDLEGPEQFRLLDPKDMAASDVANLWHGGARLYTGTPDGKGGYLKGTEVQCKAGTDELISLPIIGKAMGPSLAELPEY